MEMSYKEDQSEDLQVSEDDAVAGTRCNGKEPDSEKRARYAKQVMMFLVATIGHMNLGIAQTWPNTLASDMQDSNSTLFDVQLQLSNWELDLINSMLFVGTLPGFLLGGWVAARQGRRRAMIVSSLPCAVGWALIFLAINPAMMLVGRVVSGIAFGVIGVAVRSYLAEIADTPIRGAAGLTTEVMKGVGGIVIIALGIVVPWYYLCLICGCHILIYGLVIVPLLPESPTYLVVRNNEKEACKILRRLRGPFADLDEEIVQLKEQNDRKDGGSGFWVIFKPDVFKKVMVLFGLFLISNFCGVEVIRANALRMLQTSGLALDADISMILMSALYLGGIVSQASLTDRIGRRKCLILSLVLLVIAYTALGTCVFLDTPAVEIVPLVPEANATVPGDVIRPSTSDTWNWIPTASLMVAAFSTSLGIGPLPWMLPAEYFPTNIRSQMMGVCTCIGSAMAFVGLQLYSPLQNALTPAGLYWSYAGVAAIGVVYTLTLITETRGRKVG